MEGAFRRTTINVISILCMGSYVYAAYATLCPVARIFQLATFGTIRLQGADLHRGTLPKEGEQQFQRIADHGQQRRGCLGSGIRAQFQPKGMCHHQDVHNLPLVEDSYAVDKNGRAKSGHWHEPPLIINKPILPLPLNCTLRRGERINYQIIMEGNSMSVATQTTDSLSFGVDSPQQPKGDHIWYAISTL